VAERAREPGERPLTSARGRARREQLLQAAMEAFATRGYRGASIASIAADVGISQAGLLHHFPTKEHLLVGVLELRHREDAATVRHLAERPDGRLLDALLDLARHNAERPGLVRLFTVLAAEGVDEEHPGNAWFVERYRSVRDQMTVELAEEQRQGRLAADVDARSLATLIIAVFDGLQLQWLLDPDEVDMVAVLARFFHHLLPHADD
jgi:AcrR family transcriptional regulator